MSEKFWNKIANRYSKSPVADQQSYEKKLKITQQYFTPNMDVLEFGCGTGTTAIIHSPFVKSILATDISSNMLQIAKEKSVSNNIDNIQFKKSSFEELELADELFDVVMGHSILHLLNDPDEVIAKVYQKLKKGGVFVTSTICMGDSFILSMLARLVSFASLLGLLPALRVLSSNELLKSLSEAGFYIDYEWKPKKRGSIFIVAKK